MREAFPWRWSGSCLSSPDLSLVLTFAVMEYQMQINSVKTKLQETRARKKQQEDLIMKVVNEALKVRS